MNLSKAAAALGKLGGQSKSPAKRRASRENGKRGGRPKKLIQLNYSTPQCSAVIFKKKAKRP
jgi:hypothetical protein